MTALRRDPAPPGPAPYLPEAARRPRRRADREAVPAAVAVTHRPGRDPEWAIAVTAGAEGAAETPGTRAHRPARAQPPQVSPSLFCQVGAGLFAGCAPRTHSSAVDTIKKKRKKKNLIL